ncbi:MAG: UDP-N-acetylmuramoylalanyl-D-glutamyl-2, 6-diaminopimelate--D-alanyl-D-alanine ligase, partial [Proteobacteria bacterium]|nr:UDP-N-acetylmuramoylalanyl-D-glutamyl-2, 6-diaminopimelate--D-alanyl-D-alanine ligase [Pseudomonadota bacterium]
GLSAAVPASMDALHTDTSDGLIGLLTETIRAGDVVTVKGSLGSRMAPVVEALLGLDAGNGDDRRQPCAVGGQG